MTLSEKAKRRKRCCAGAIFIGDNGQTQSTDLEKVEAQFFTLVGGSPGAEVVFLNQDLAIGSTSIFGDLDADFLGLLARGLLNFVDQTRDRLRLIKFHNDALDRIRTRADPTRSSRAGVSVEQMFSWMGWAL